MLDGTKKLFPTEYKNFIQAMKSAAEDGNLPVALQLEDVGNVTLKDVEEMFCDFKRDTSLDITGMLFLCNDCGRLHMITEVTYPEKKPTILQ
jgi:hypothetical protein